MSFYGTLVKIFSKIKIGNNYYEQTQGNECIDITQAFEDREAALTTQLTVSIQEAGRSDDNKLLYTIKQGEQEIGKIDIPLDLILESSEIVHITEATATEALPVGTYLKLVFKTDENVTENYINVTELNEVAGAATDTITVTVDEAQQITAAIKSKSITQEHLSDELTSSITAEIDAAKNEAIASARGVNFEYDSTNQNLKIYYNN